MPVGQGRSSLGKWPVSQAIDWRRNLQIVIVGEQWRTLLYA